ncbi:ectoine hydroxylase [Nocardia terpenica]|uniref:Ectoine hydroxylase n=1 Tax=Nocardia terpenica TaxID=455432 RepID=A0A164JB58_9NOCA|nr:ectoine hydroxylase [Nocardia terpenica]KZM70227.1 ectoine hydroxylase [Nocardia terpenica]MBF6066303.1 ectoine hydroxylase [Nocardia terpenica]MBF6108567.1 ectoine hydroxylase [Nocardia terpenica]MBF6116113.1 ectoine hydroxylase [Nocardia terpenica]MBF6123766.1 ectoine hydroxylase [Nocardia terpenica]
MTLADSRIDRYPTRTSAAAPPGERTDPTVWGAVTAPALASFDADGYAIIDELLSTEEVAAFSAEIDRLAADPELRLDERVIIEKKSNRVRSIFEVHRISAAVAELVRDERVVGLARQVLGSEVYIHQSRVNYMPGFEGTGFYWHSDFETWHAEDGMPSPRACSLSIALTDNYPFNGSLMVMPGSHRTFVPCQGETPADHYRESLREQQIGVPSHEHITELADRYGIAQFTGARGSALLFDSNIMHGSGNNITPFPRSNIFLVFNSVENTLSEPYSAPARRPTYIASRDFDPVR